MNEIAFILMLKIFLGLVVILLLTQGFLWSFMPESNLERNGISTHSILGLSVVRTDIGAGLFSVAAFLILFILKGKKWFLPAFIMVAAFLVIRIIGFLIDGYHPTVVQGILLETLALLAVIGLDYLRSKNSIQQHN